MRALIFLAFITFIGAPLVSFAQTPPQPADDFPQPMPNEGKKSGKKLKPMVERENRGIKPPLPVTPPKPEPTLPSDADTTKAP